MIIDSHTHIYPDKIAASTVDKLSSVAGLTPCSDGSASGLRADMKKSGIDLSVVLPVATNPLKTEHLNDFAMTLDGSDGLLSLGAMHPDFENPDAELKRLCANGVKGIKIHPVYQGVDFDDIRYLRIFDTCASLGLAVVTHAGCDVGFPGEARCMPEQILNALHRVGNFTLVLAHMGAWNNWDEALEKLSETNVYIDTSFAVGCCDYADSGRRLPAIREAFGSHGDFLSTTQFMRFVEAFGADRILFGSDTPWFSPVYCMNFVNSLQLSDEDKRKIFSDNAKRVFGI